MDAKYMPWFRKLQELTLHSYEKQLSFLQHVLLVASSVLSIVISLHTNNESPLYIRWVFAIAVSLLTAGVVTCSIALYMQTRIPERGRQLYVREHIQSIRTGKEPQPASVHKTATHLFCEKATCILLPLSILLLAVYTILLTFSE